MVEAFAKLLCVKHKINKLLDDGNDVALSELLKFMIMQNNGRSIIWSGIFRELRAGGPMSNDLIDRLSNKLELILIDDLKKQTKMSITTQKKGNSNEYRLRASVKRIGNNNSIINSNNSNDYDNNKNIGIIDLPTDLLSHICTFLPSQEILTSVIHLSHLFFQIGWTSSSLHYWKFCYYRRQLPNFETIPKFKLDSMLAKLKILDYSYNFSPVFDIR